MMPSAMIFDDAARAAFSAAYPEMPHKLTHGLADEPLLSITALAELAEALPISSVEHNPGDLAVNGSGGSADAIAIGPGAAIRAIASANSWAALKNIEQMPAYNALLMRLLEELRPTIEAHTGAMLKPQGFIFVSSPGAITPYHFDPEHNILLQIMGHKVMTQFPAGHDRYAPDTTHEAYHTGGGRDLHWNDGLAAGGTAFALAPGEALFVPVMAPHHVKNGDAPSVSLSITWRSEWSFAEADARAFNGLLRRVGLKPRAPGRYPSRNRLKSTGWRVYAKLTGRR